MTNYWILEPDGKTPVPVLNRGAWSRWYTTSPHDRLLFRTIIGPFTVSTVFVGMDYNFFGGLPLLWETTIFGREDTQVERRYSTYDDAVAGHAISVLETMERYDGEPE